MNKSRQWIALALGLAILGGLIFFYKVHRLGYPPLPDQLSNVWSIQARMEIRPRSGPVRADLALPHRPQGYLVSEENFISRGFGLTVNTEGGQKSADWAIRRLPATKVLYYRAMVIPDTRKRDIAPSPDYPAIPELPEPFATALTDIVSQVRVESADTETFATAVFKRLVSGAPDESTALFLSEARTPADRTRLAQTLLAGAHIPTLPIHGVMLQEDVQRAEIKTLLGVYNGDEWLIFDPITGRQGMPNQFLVWWTGDREIADVSGAHLNDIQLSIKQRTVSSLDLATQRAEDKGSKIGLISILQLPVQTQSVYEILLLIPIGVLVIVILRNIVGLRSFGTFAPVLIALAFRETELLKGILLFVLIVSLGLFFRFYLERLRLLLVPRLAAVVTIVVLLMTGISIISHQMGTETGLSVSLFPMIIISMVVERMSVVWEERGSWEAILEGMGSLLMAALAYLIMGIEILEYWFTVYPELLLIILGLIIALGRYTGFRLTELGRFKGVAES